MVDIQWHRTWCWRGRAKKCSASYETELGQLCGQKHSDTICVRERYSLTVPVLLVLREILDKSQNNRDVEMFDLVVRLEVVLRSC